jgi:hypothetical protein
MFFIRGGNPTFSFQRKSWGLFFYSKHFLFKKCKAKAIFYVHYAYKT